MHAQHSLVGLLPVCVLDAVLTLAFVRLIAFCSGQRAGLPRRSPSERRMLEQYVEEQGGDKPIYRCTRAHTHACALFLLLKLVGTMPWNGVPMYVFLCA